jgi:hypothetical protein
MDINGQDIHESAIVSGCIDFVLLPEDITKETVRIAHAESKETQSPYLHK